MPARQRLVRRVLLSGAGLGIVIAALTAITAAQRHPTLRLNLTPSLAEGLYWASYDAAPPRRGDTVMVCLPMGLAAFAEARGYIGHGDCDDRSAVLLKQVAAIGGDTVQVGEAGIAVNGAPLADTAALPSDDAGRAMSRMPPGLYPVPEHVVWLLATGDRRSFDSRYFGPVHEVAIIGRARPLLTF